MKNIILLLTVFIIFSVVFENFTSFAASPKTNASKQKKISTKLKTSEREINKILSHQRFHFVVLDSEKIQTEIDFIQIIDEKGNELGSLDFGPFDTKGDSFVDLTESGGRWGNAGKDGAVTFRKVAGRNSVWEHSAFSIALNKPFSENLIIKVRYKDTGTELLPLEYQFNGKAIRIGQLYFENTGKWIEEEFDIPFTK